MQKNATFFKKSLIFYIAIVATTAAILLFYFAGNLHNLNIPLNFSGDILNHLIIIKAIITHGWWWYIPELSAPAGLQLIEFPIAGMLDTFIYKFLTVFTSKPGLVVNLYFFLSIVLSAATAAWAMLRLGISRYVTFCCSILFAIIPQVFYRGELQIWYVAYTVPVIAAFSVLIISGQITQSSKKDLVIFYLFSFLIGLNYIYFGFFAAFFLLVATFLGYLNHKTSYIGVGALIILFIAEFINLFPTSYAWHHDPATVQMLQSFKSSIQTMDNFGLRVRDLIIPNDYHFLPALAKFTYKVVYEGLMGDNENIYTKIGMIGSMGLLLLLLVNLTWDKLGIVKRFPLLIPIATLNLAGILFATVGGFGSLLNIFLSSQIHCYNRIAVFLAFFCLCAFAYILDDCLITRGGKLKYQLLSLSALIGVFIFGIFDQNASQIMIRSINHHRLSYLSQESLITRIEITMPCHSRIFQLPIEYNTAKSGFERSAPHEHLRSYVLSNECLTWSWPPLHIDAWQAALNDLSTKELLTKICQAGFSGLWIDGKAYTDLTSLIKNYATTLQEAPLESNDHRFYFFDLRQACRTI